MDQRWQCDGCSKKAWAKGKGLPPQWTGEDGRDYCAACRFTQLVLPPPGPDAPRVHPSRIPKPIVHGTMNAYKKRHCRCEKCREANRLYKHEWEVSRIIYAVSRPDTREIKIGMCINLTDRLRTLQCGSGEPLVVLGFLHATAQREQELHTQFAAHRKLGEWFHDVPEIRAWIAAECQTDAEERSA